MTGSLVAARAAKAARAPAPAAPVAAGPAASPDTSTAPLLTVSGLSLSYGRVRALDEINLTVGSGELVALAGENGAGKTTLVRCIAGDVVPASGEIHLGGRRIPSDPAGAAKQGVAVVWQDLALCDNLDVAANIMLGRERRWMLFSDSRFHAAAASLLDELRIPLKDTTRSVRDAVRRAAPAGRGGPGHGPQAAAAGPGRAHRRPRRQGIGAGRRADHDACGSRAPRSCLPATTSIRCSGWPTGSWYCARAVWSPICARPTLIPTTWWRCCPASRLTHPRAAS